MSAPSVTIPIRNGSLPGVLSLPPHPVGMVLCASGRNRTVAERLARANVGTLMLDFLTEREAHTLENALDIALLADRLRQATVWVAARPGCADLPIGYLGAGMAAAAALVAAAEWGEPAIGVVVTSGGRPDLAGDTLPLVRAPTLLIVGGADADGLAHSRLALARLTTVKRLVIVPGASRLPEVPGALAAVAERATSWFAERLPARVARLGIAR